MREIKFRAWVANERMEYLPELQYNSKQFCKLYTELDNQRRGAVLLQHTDLKDKNGKEVYEGDILRRNNNVFEIRWNAEYAEFEPRTTNDWTPVLRFIIDSAEIIGNIYENPELLK